MRMNERVLGKSLVVGCLVAAIGAVGAAPMDKWEGFKCSDSLMMKAELQPVFMKQPNRQKATIWCPVCDDSTASMQTLPIQSMAIARIAKTDSCKLKLNGQTMNPAKLWVFQGDSIWQNVRYMCVTASPLSKLNILPSDSIFMGLRADAGDSLLRLIPAYIKGGGDVSMARIKWAVALPHGETLYAIYGKRLGTNWNGEPSLLDRPGVYVENFMMWSDTKGEEGVPSLIGTFSDAASGSKYVVFQHMGLGRAAYGCGDLTVLLASANGDVSPVGDIPNSNCTGEDGWELRAATGASAAKGVVVIREKGRKGGAVFVVGHRGLVKSL